MNDLSCNSNAQARILMLELTLYGTGANLNALHRHFNLNGGNTLFELFDQSAKLNDKNAHLNDGFRGTDLLSEFE